MQFKKITKIIVKRPKTVIAAMLSLMLIAGALGGGVIKKLTPGGFDDINSDSYKAAQRIEKDFKRKRSNVLVSVTFKDGLVTDEKNVTTATEIENNLRSTENMSDVYSYWTSGKSPALKGNNNKQALILGTLAGSEDEVAERIKKIASDFSFDNNNVLVGTGGLAEINHQFTTSIEKDLRLAEIIALPVTLLILMFVFRSVIAASLPILVGLFAIMGSLLVLDILTKFTNVSIYALNLTTMLGLGLAIDYSLFIVSRFREHLAKGESVDESVGYAIQKAGKTVMFSALTVAVSLVALLVFPQTFLKSFAFAGVAVALVAALGSIVLLPAVLKVLGHNINKWRVGPAIDYEHGSKFWHRVAVFVMKRPIPVALAAISLLLFLGVPFLSINLGRDDERSLPKDNPARVVHDSMRANFTSRETSGIDIVSLDTSNVNLNTIESYSKNLSNLKGVDHVESAAGIFAQGTRVATAVTTNQYIKDKGMWLAVVPRVEPFSTEGEQLTKTIRNTNAPFTVQVGGNSASLVDLKQSIYDKLPNALLIISVTTFVLLFIMFGGILVPINALLINVLSLSAVFGIVVWIFQKGHFADALNFTSTGMIEATMPILMFCVAFGLSMDYEVFLLSRIKEFYNKTGDNRSSVSRGLEMTGGIVTAAAVSISVVFFAFASSSVTTIKLMGFGLAIAVLLDAFLIRGTLVPAFMRLTGKANWWAPKFMKKIYERFGISD